MEKPYYSCHFTLKPAGRFGVGGRRLQCRGILFLGEAAERSASAAEARPLHAGVSTRPITMSRDAPLRRFIAHDRHHGDVERNEW